MDDYRVIIAGSRSFSNYELLKEHCLSLLQEKMRTHRVIIVSGHAHGADTMGERFAKEQGLTVELHPAKWRGLGKAAGMIRNAEMARASDALIAFWNGKSRGTAHMISFARRRGLEVSIVDELNLNPSFTSHPDKSVTSTVHDEKQSSKSWHR
ncbi:MAG: SLOG family protein [Bacteroidales bacterium]|nr:SLOG family protein [Bacteroidales bacterium]